jgi:hypothetical protein
MEVCCLLHPHPLEVSGECAHPFIRGPLTLPRSITCYALSPTLPPLHTTPHHSTPFHSTLSHVGPPGASFGYQPGGWGKPPVDENGVPVYGDVFGSNSNDADSDEEVDKLSRWGELDVEESEEEESEEEEEMGGEFPAGRGPWVEGGWEGGRS